MIASGSCTAARLEGISTPYRVAYVWGWRQDKACAHDLGAVLGADQELRHTIIPAGSELAFQRLSPLTLQEVRAGKHKS